MIGYSFILLLLCNDSEVGGYPWAASGQRLGNHVPATIQELCFIGVYKGEKITTRYKLLCYRTHKQSIQKLLLQTEQFIWEDLPARNDSGSLTMAGIIPLIQKVTKYMSLILLIPNGIHMLIRGIGSEELGLDMWFPFDASSSPVHEIIVIVQVRAGEILSVYLFNSLPVLPAGDKVQNLDTSKIQPNTLSQFHPPPIITNYLRRNYLMLPFRLFLGHVHNRFPTGCTSAVRK